MAVVKNFLQITGSIKGVSFYTKVGSDKVIMRTKGGAKKETIQNGPRFEKLRKHQVEWQGCVRFAQSMRDAIGETYRLSDFNLTPVWTGMGRQIVKLDTVTEIGKRFLCFSQCKQEMEGYNLNKTYPFASILQVSPLAELNRETLSATVSLPRINTASDLQNIQRLPYFRLIICLGMVSDMPAHVLSVHIDEYAIPLLTEDVTVLLSMGIEFGNVGFGGVIEPVKHTGCGKILLCR